jgi:prevent-host-death family protein
MSTIISEPSHQVRDHFAEVIERDEPTIITRHGREVAAVIPIADFRYLHELENQELRRIIESRKSELDGPTYPLTDVIAETLARRD